MHRHVTRSRALGVCGSSGLKGQQVRLTKASHPEGSLVGRQRPTSFREADDSTFPMTFDLLHVA